MGVGLQAHKVTDDLIQLNALVVKSNEPLSTALKYITLQEVQILLYSVSSEGELVNINDFKGIVLPPPPYSFSKTPIKYKFDQNNYFLSYAQTVDGGGLLLIKEAHPQLPWITFGIIEGLLILLFLFLFGFNKRRRNLKLVSIKNDELNDQVQLSNALAHELKTPLAAIQGFVDLLSTEGSNPTPAHYVERIQSNIFRLELSIEQILALNAVLTNGLERESIDLNALILNLVKDFESNFPERKIIVNLGKSIKINNKDSVTLILNNILSNFVKHAPSKSKLEVISIDSQDAVTVIFTQSGKVGTVKNNKGIGLELIHYLAQRSEVGLTTEENYSYKLNFKAE